MNVAYSESHLLTVRREAQTQSKSILNLSGNQWQAQEGQVMHRLADAGLTQLKWIARGEARKCKRIYKEELTKTGGDEMAAYVELEVHLNILGIDEPDAETVNGKIMRMICPKWWRRRLRVKQARAAECKAIAKKVVNKNRECYASNETVMRRKAQRGQNDRVLENITAINDIGQEYTLYDLAQLSVSNPTIKRAELMTRIKGFEQYAKNWSDVAEFYTITCPSKMHPSSRKYDGTTPKQAQEHLTKQWEKIRSKLDRNNIEIYGFRVVEPHHDGCPHWHLLLFMDATKTAFVRSVIKDYALEVDGKEAGAEKYRFKAERILTGTNPKTGREYSAAGYIAKYISKAIDGYGVDVDLFGNDAQAASARIEAWASTWSIRQFQQIGGASVTVWRELRRLRDEEINGSELLERARACADAGDWAGYCQLNWNKEIQLMKKDQDGEKNQYGELKTMSIYGVEAGGVGVVTRPFQWDIGVSGREAERVSAEPWTRVNNCTGSLLEELRQQFKNDYLTIHYPCVEALMKNAGVSESVAERSEMGKYIKTEVASRIGEDWHIDKSVIDQLKVRFESVYDFETLADELEDTGQSIELMDEYRKNRFDEFLSEYFYDRFGIYFINDEVVK
ncbi:hypothetical protein CYQ88_10870 [Hydrogenovibrio sp. SC-1]|uniref:replication endonuclease n=1 Tax=Hydrogenovibrio sp. SC-1 TaxID=2065820 RepID=UPI000C7DF339|nr:replication endonuclease [Hydrogenovibrio sp. SC-1]PLA73517.1 hypothetical protein CYQ88_10870 [Hydrogenovibrio sp. SC-1]